MKTTGNKEFDEKVADFIAAERLSITDEATRFNTKDGWTQDITVQDYEGDDHFFVYSLSNGKHAFICESEENDDGTPWGVQE